MTVPTTNTVLTNDHPGLLSQWHPIARVGADGGVGPAEDSVIAAELFARRYVVTVIGGVVTVAPDACPHRGVRLSRGEIVEGCLRCPYHGWRFGPTGECVAIPAIGESPVPSRADLPTVPNEVALGLVWIRGDHGADGFDPIDVAEWGAVGIDAAWMSDVVVGCSAGQFIDNFLDIAHFRWSTPARSVRTRRPRWATLPSSPNPTTSGRGRFGSGTPTRSRTARTRSSTPVSIPSCSRG